MSGFSGVAALLFNKYVYNFNPSAKASDGLKTIDERPSLEGQDEDVSKPQALDIGGGPIEEKLEIDSVSDAIGSEGIKAATDCLDERKQFGLSTPGYSS